MADPRPALAVDIGGTKLAAGLVEPAGRVLTWSVVPTPAGRTPSSCGARSTP